MFFQHLIQQESQVSWESSVDGGRGTSPTAQGEDAGAFVEPGSKAGGLQYLTVHEFTRNM